VAPQLIGLGLLEAVPEATLEQLADPDDRDRDGISGRIQRVWNETRGAEDVGRFGWKAEQPSVRAQTAGAFLGDMGITSSLFSSENHSARQPEASARPSGGAPELEENVLNAVVLYARTLAVPQRRGEQDAQVRAGEQRFTEAGCARCHVPTLTTAHAEPNALSQQTIHPYTDLLLHDLGDALGDQRPSYAASGNEWRTPPLWGVGLVHEVNGHTLLLHDGRARGVSEAILWHGGEAQSARDAFVRMDKQERAQLVAFVESR
jgi:CxxC motif-containing protein (DUF1111 family)